MYDAQQRVWLLKKREDATSKPELTAKQKRTATIFGLTYGIGENVVDKDCIIGKSTALETMKGFTKRWLNASAKTFYDHQTKIRLLCYIEVQNH